MKELNIRMARCEAAINAVMKQIDSQNEEMQRILNGVLLNGKRVMAIEESVPPIAQQITANNNNLIALGEVIDKELQVMKKMVKFRVTRMEDPK